MAIGDKNITGETFWLNIASENIYSSFEKRTASVKNLKTLIEWAFGLFITGGFILNVFDGVENFNSASLALFAIAFFLLTVSYALASHAQYPVTSNYHPNDISDISMAFGRAVKTQSIFFKWAAGITLFGFFFLALGIMFLFYYAKKPPETISINPLSLKTFIEKKDTSYFIPVTIMTTPDSKIDLSITGVNKTDSVILYDRTFPVDSTGRMSYSYDASSDTTFKIFYVRAGIQETKADTVTERFTTVKIIKK